MPRTLSSSEFEELGKRYYKQKEYAKALDAFTEGIDASLSPNVDLLDCRAATFEKLGNLDAALRDGRRMIQLNKKSVKVSMPVCISHYIQLSSCSRDTFELAKFYKRKRNSRQLWEFISTVPKM
jgi:tetratricopeptide (TPR) repeat protein